MERVKKIAHDLQMENPTHCVVCPLLNFSCLDYGEIGYDEELEFKIVGSSEASSLKGKISNESPVGKALLGAKVGDTVNVETQAGIVQYKVLEIQRAN